MRRYLDDEMAPGIAEFVEKWGLPWAMDEKMKKELKDLFAENFEAAMIGIAVMYTIALAELGIVVTGINITYAFSMWFSRVLRMLRFLRAFIPELPVWTFP